jgi:hypothetical protein
MTEKSVKTIRNVTGKSAGITCRNFLRKRRRSTNIDHDIVISGICRYRTVRGVVREHSIVTNEKTCNDGIVCKDDSECDR